MADNWQDTADAVNRAVTGAVESLEDVFEKERTVYGGATWVESLTSSAGIGKGFRFPSVEGANKIINSFKDRQRSIDERKRLIREARDVLERPFAADTTSLSYIRRAQDSLEKLDELNNSALAYVANYVSKLEGATRVKMRAEEEIGSSFDRSGGAN